MVSVLSERQEAIRKKCKDVLPEWYPDSGTTEILLRIMFEVVEFADIQLEDRRICADLMEVFKITHGIFLVDIETFFKFDQSISTRGHILKLKKDRVATLFQRNNFPWKPTVDNLCTSLVWEHYQMLHIITGRKLI